MCPFKLVLAIYLLQLVSMTFTGAEKISSNAFQQLDTISHSVQLCWRTGKIYHKVPKFSDARKLCFNLPKIQTKSPNPTVFRQKDANGIANSEDPDRLPRPIGPKT